MENSFLRRYGLNRSVNYIRNSRFFQITTNKLTRQNIIKGLALNLTIILLYSYYHSNSNKTLKCANEKILKNDYTEKDAKTEQRIKLNDLQNLTSIVQYNANDPLEDRYVAVELKNFNGYFLSVLDGHGGYQIAEFAKQRLASYFDEIYLNNKNSTNNKNQSEDSIVLESLNQTFLKIVKFIIN